MVFKPAGVLDKDGLVKFLEMFDGAGSSTYKFTPHPTDPKKWISPAGLIWEGQSVSGAPREGHRTIHVLTHAVENPGRTLANEAHGIFTIPSDQLFPLLDSFVGNVPGLTKMPVVGRANTWDMTFQNFVGLADNSKRTFLTGRQSAPDPVLWPDAIRRQRQSKRSGRPSRPEGAIRRWPSSGDRTAV